MLSSSGLTCDSHLKNAAIDVGSDEDPRPSVIDNSVIQGQFTFNKCVDVHIGPKFENSGNIVVNQNISVSSERELSRTFQISAKGVAVQSYHNADYVVCYDIQLRTIIQIIVFLVVTLAAVIIFIVANHYLENDFNPAEDGSEGPNPPTQDAAKDYPMNMRFVSRDSWGAAQPLEELNNNTTPINLVIFIHTVSSGTCNKYSACKQQVLNIQDVFMVEHHYEDIGYNFVLGSDGYIYVGLGWDKVGIHTKGYNIGSLGVAFIGDFRTDETNDLMMSSAIRLLKFGVEIKKISENYQLLGHCQTSKSFPFSPGKNILKVIQNWPHWNNTNLHQCFGF